MKKFNVEIHTLETLQETLDRQSQMGWEVVSIMNTDAERNLLTIVWCQDLRLYRAKQEAAQRKDWKALDRLYEGRY